MPTNGYFGRNCNKPINKTAVFLFLNLFFLWHIITIKLYTNTLNCHNISFVQISSATYFLPSCAHLPDQSMSHW